jgi:hypothetical protein
MAYTQSDLDLLSKAITAGIKSVTYADGRRVEYQTLADMRALRSDMKEEVAAAMRTRQPRTTVGRVMRR